MGIGFRAIEPSEVREFLVAAETSFGEVLDDLDEDTRRFSRLLEPARTLVAEDDAAFVGTAAAFTFRLSVPGAEVPAAGVTLVGVLPTHRRQGILTEMMRRQIDDVKERGEPIAILWASEALIYPRFGYGLASIQCTMDVEQERTTFRPAPVTHGHHRLVSLEEAAIQVGPVYEQVRTRHAGMFARSPDWWTLHTLFVPAQTRQDGGRKFCVVWEREGVPAAYALYRIVASWGAAGHTSELQVQEAVGVDAQATREIWRYLFSVDLVARIRVTHSGIPVDHPLVTFMSQMRRLRATMGDGLWLRLINLRGALEGRAYHRDGSIVLRVRDTFCPWNDGLWRLETHGGDAVATKAAGEADLALDVQDLAAVYLGGTTFRRLSDAGLLDEPTEGAIKRADELFATERAPWCPEIF